MLDHVIVTVNDFTRSIAFYAQALKPLGITDFLDYKGQDGHPDLKGFGNDGRFFFWLKEGRPNPDAVHFGFVAKSHADVNAFFVAAIAAGGREKTAPAPQLQYHPDYYATWVLDPDGHDVEVVNKTGQIDDHRPLGKANLCRRSESGAFHRRDQWRPRPEPAAYKGQRRGL